MKTRAQKCGVYAALAAVLLITAALITSCPPPIGELTGSFRPPVGELPEAPRQTGYLRVGIANDSSARTILPVNVSPTYFQVDIERTTTPATGDVDITNYGVSGTVTGGFSVPVASLGSSGNFDVTVRAYAASGSGLMARGTGTLTAFDPSDGGSVDSPIVLTALAVSDDDYNGTFKWAITLPSATADVVDTATMVVTKYSGGGSTGVTALDSVNLKTNPNSPTTPTAGYDIPAGYYNVKVTLVKAKHRTVIVNEILHIYAGMTSTYTDSFAALSRNRYNVTYVNVSGLDDDPEGTDTDFDDNGGLGWLHDGLITPPSTPTYDGDPPLLVFEKWYKENTLSTEWDFDNDKIIGDMYLYANWVPPISLGVTVTYDDSNPTEGLTINTPTLSLAKSALVGAGAVRTFTLVGTYTNVAITFTNGEDTTPTDITSDYVSGTGIVTLTFTDTGNMGSPIAGDYVISINAQVGSVPYSGTFRLTVTP